MSPLDSEELEIRGVSSRAEFSSNSKSRVLFHHTQELIWSTDPVSISLLPTQEVGRFLEFLENSRPRMWGLRLDKGNYMYCSL